jgi:deazaflavin-dependent oxidoreductase (nitroreductase family)
MSNYQDATVEPAPAAMDDIVRRALRHGHTIDITTTGRKSGIPRRIEIVFHNFDGRIYLSGLPRANRRRSWLANLVAHPAFTFHLKGPVTADLPATAREVTDPVERRAVLTKVARVWNRTDLDTMVAHAPLVEVTILDPEA